MSDEEVTEKIFQIEKQAMIGDKRSMLRIISIERTLRLYVEGKLWEILKDQL